MAVRRRNIEVQPELSVVPFIDIVLVLMILFMAASPSINSNIHINVPQVTQDADDQGEQYVTPKTVTVSLNADLELFITSPRYGLIDEPKTSGELGPFLAAIIQNEPETKVFIRSDASAAYQHVADVMALAKNAGVESLNLVTMGVGE